MKAAGESLKQDALNQLLVQFKVVSIWTRVCTTAGETATDSYHTDFEELVHYAEQIANSGAGLTTPQPLSFDIQILGPLYYAALKCRHPATRRRALEMLRLAPRVEGLWNGHYAYTTAKRVIEVEEKHLNGEGWPDETSRVHHLPLPGEVSQIYKLSETSPSLQKSSRNIVPSPACPCVLKIVFYTKPWGLLGQWQTTTEYIEI
ncbi:hypothetical protein HJFPF1_03978 [Paramyrothecium foliicola]|nr:hypothetical protein HJFPF1_03978 [Paramyrothecium foliicola]